MMIWSILEHGVVWLIKSYGGPRPCARAVNKKEMKLTWTQVKKKR